MEKLSGINLVSVLVDFKKEQDFSGRIINQYSEEELKFSSCMDMISRMDALYDDWGFPEASEKPRSFSSRRFAASLVKEETEPKKRLVNLSKEMEARDITGEKGEVATFHILTEMRQHSSWQGKVFYVEGQHRAEFRSVLELLFFIDSALNK